MIKSKLMTSICLNYSVLNSLIFSMRPFLFILLRQSLFLFIRSVLNFDFLADDDDMVIV